MANSSRKRGFQPFERIMRESPYVAGGTVYPGDLVIMGTDGKITTASTGSTPMGVAAHYATTGNTLLVWDHPEQKYVAQVKTGTTIAQSDMGSNADIAANAGDSTYKQSRQEIDGSTAATTSTLPIRLLAISPAVDNAAGDLAKVVCSINAGRLRPGQTGLA